MDDMFDIACELSRLNIMGKEEIRKALMNAECLATTADGAPQNVGPAVAQNGTVPVQGGGMSPVAPVRERPMIWNGILEWIEKPKNPNDTTELTRHVPCGMSTNPKDGDLELKADSWPQKLVLKLMPKQLLATFGAYLKNSTCVLFHLELCEALESLTEVMSSGHAGSVILTSVQSCGVKRDIKALILLYVAEKRAYLGFIPNDQAGFNQRVREVLELLKRAQALRRRQEQGQVGAGIDDAGMPDPTAGLPGNPMVPNQ